LGGWLVVAVIDALLSDEAGRRKTALQTGRLLWRTLRLLGREVVSLGLFRALAQQLVDKGTIHRCAVQIAWTRGMGDVLGVLRWRTLRLLGRVVVSLGLFLALTQQLVGKGTIYSWAVQIAWILGIGVALVVVRWWSHIIFHHVGVQRKKGPILRWVERT